MAEIEIGLGAVVEDEHLAVLERVHRSRVDVDVRIELLDDDLQTTRREEAAEAEVMPLPRPEATPPVTKMNFDRSLTTGPDSSRGVGRSGQDRRERSALRPLARHSRAGLDPRRLVEQLLGM